jgi:hypothetical protein
VFKILFRIFFVNPIYILKDRHWLFTSTVLHFDSRLWGSVLDRTDMGTRFFAGVMSNIEEKDNEEPKSPKKLAPLISGKALGRPTLTFYEHCPSFRLEVSQSLDSR